MKWFISSGCQSFSLAQGSTNTFSSFGEVYERIKNYKYQFILLMNATTFYNLEKKQTLPVVPGLAPFSVLEKHIFLNERISSVQWITKQTKPAEETMAFCKSWLGALAHEIIQFNFVHKQRSSFSKANCLTLLWIDLHPLQSDAVLCEEDKEKDLFLFCFFSSVQSSILEDKQIH